MQACLTTGAHCIIDIHNFARWDGEIIGQGGPTNDQFASLWRQLAKKYASEQRVVFELMNEPHDLDIAAWAQTCQAAVTAIREAGAADQIILLPGSNFDSAATLADAAEGGGEQLLAVTNPDGSTNGLFLDVHKYLDEDNSGTHDECVTDNADAFGSVADFLRRRSRQGIVSETGASGSPSCVQSFCSQNGFINDNSDVLVGLVGWAAGSFDTSYLLSLTPRKEGDRLVDNTLTSQCLVGTWKNASNNPLPTMTTRVATGAATESATMIFTLTGTPGIPSQPTEPTDTDTGSLPGNTDSPNEAEKRKLNLSWWMMTGLGTVFLIGLY